jgi:hypothetical protein
MIISWFHLATIYYQILDDTKLIRMEEVLFPGNEERSYASFGLFINAWMPLPEPYKED